MPERSFYVPPESARNDSAADLVGLLADLGEPPWRGPIIGSPSLRVVIHHWPPGHATVPHHHPRGHEIFLVLRGRAGFVIGDTPERVVGPEVVLSAPPGVRHAVRVVGDEPLLLFTAVAPNEDRPDETVE
jgi:mannose-6-phosphate isomerase-like protein (cupin superfamily)